MAVKKVKDETKNVAVEVETPVETPVENTGDVTVEEPVENNDVQEVEVETPVETTEEVSVDTTKADVDTSNKPSGNVKIRMRVDHKCCIAMERYDLKAGKTYTVPENVKRILNNAGLLAPL